MWQSFLEFYKANSAFSSTVLGIVIAVLTFYLRERYNRKRILRKILCHLLNLYWYQSRLMGVEKMLRQEVSKMIHSLAEEFSPNAEKQEIDAVVKQLEPVIAQTVGLTHSHFNYPTESFHKDLEELSRDFPVLAYQLRGTEDIAQLHHDLFDHLKNSLTDLESRDAENLFKTATIEAEDPLETLEEGILKTARKVSWLSYANVSFRILTNTKAGLSEKALQKRADKIRKSIRDLISEQSQKAEANQPSVAT